MSIKYFIYTAVLEGVALAPVAVSGIGHAGPNGGFLVIWQNCDQSNFPLCKGEIL